MLLLFRILLEREQTSGWLEGAWSKGRRKREEEEELADRLEVQLAAEGLVPPNPAAEIRITVREYPPMKRRTQRAVDYALKVRTDLAYQLALRELAREQEEEEYALLLALAAA